MIRYNAAHPGADQLADNLRALEQGPPTRDEDAWMRRFGKVVHG